MWRDHTFSRENKTTNFKEILQFQKLNFSNFSGPKGG